MTFGKTVAHLSVGAVYDRAVFAIGWGKRAVQSNASRCDAKDRAYRVQSLVIRRAFALPAAVCFIIAFASNRLEAEDRVTPAPVFSSGESETVPTPPQDPAQKPPEPQHTGTGAVIRTIGGDFKAFLRRRSTYVFLAIGGAAGGLAHSADDDVNRRVQGSKAVGRLFAPGKYVGHAGVQ